MDEGDEYVLLNSQKNPSNNKYQEHRTKKFHLAEPHGNIVSGNGALTLTVYLVCRSNRNSTR